MIIVANWKAYVEDLTKGKTLFATSKKLARVSDLRIILAPPSPFLGALALRNKSSVAFAAQDVSVTLGGAVTGEITARMSATAGATYALIGHSERRAKGDTNEIVAEKLAHAFAHGLIPILCVGESERDAEGRYLSFIREQITAGLAALAPKERAEVSIAYEPLWAIGKTAEESIGPDDLAEMVLYIRKVLAELLPGKSSRQTHVLYGGAVESGNVRDLAAVSMADGFLVGHASTNVSSFTDIVKALS